MGRRIVRNPELAPAGNAEFAVFARAAGETVARSRTTETVRVALSGRDLHVKRHRYSLSGALRGALRNTLFGRSRAAREYDALLAFHRIEAAPRPVAFGERRVLGLLREAFVATETVPGARPLSEGVPPGRETERGLALFLARLHERGFVHGRLFARNLLVDGAGELRLVDLDRATVGRGRPAATADRARDLAFLLASLESEPASRRRRACAAYRGAAEIPREAGGKFEAEIERFRREARARLERRVSRAGRTSPSSSGARPG